MGRKKEANKNEIELGTKKKGLFSWLGGIIKKKKKKKALVWLRPNPR
jgi:hypothetical protein